MRGKETMINSSMLKTKIKRDLWERNLEQVTAEVDCVEDIQRKLNLFLPSRKLGNKFPM